MSLLLAAVCTAVDTQEEASLNTAKISSSANQPTPEDSPPPPQTGEEETWRLHDQSAYSRLHALIDTMRMETPNDLLQRASELRRGSDGSARKAPAKALPLLQAIADAANSSHVPRPNSTAALVELGHMYLKGEGVPPDTSAAISYYLRAADQGSPEAQHALGVVYSTGFGAERNAPLAATYLHFASESGNVAAQLAMGYRHLLGISAPKACFKSLLYYRPVGCHTDATAARCAMLHPPWLWVQALLGSTSARGCAHACAHALGCILRPLPPHRTCVLLRPLSGCGKGRCAGPAGERRRALPREGAPDC